jgi:hypothetical protein
MAHSYTNEYDDLHPSRTHSESIQYPGHDSNASEASAENAFNLRLSAAGTLHERASAKARSAAMQQAQRLHGNRAVQRYIQHRKPQDIVPLQRQPWDVWPLEPRCPIIGPQIGCIPIGRGGAPEPDKKPPVPTPAPGKKGKQPRKGKQTKGKKPKDTGSQGGFTMTLEEFIKRTGYNPLRQLDRDRYGPGGRWPF